MKTVSLILTLVTATLLAGCKPDDTPPKSAVSSQLPTEVFRGQYSIASDPSVTRNGSTYLMSYTGYDPVTERTVICLATSLDGLAWNNVSVAGDVAGQVIAGSSGTWQERLEGNCLLQLPDAYHLYYSGYRDKGNPAPGFPAALGLATFADGINFSRHVEPILEPIVGWYDNDAIYSPSVVQTGGQFLMIYTGHCYTNCQRGAGVFLLAATSVDGVQWEKHPEPIRFTNQPD